MTYLKLLVIHDENKNVGDVMYPFEEISSLTPMRQLRRDPRGVFDPERMTYENPNGKWDGFNITGNPPFEMKGIGKCFTDDPTLSVAPKQGNFCQSARMNDIKQSSLNDFVSDAVLDNGKWIDVFDVFKTSKSREMGFYNKFLKGVDKNKILTVLTIHT